MARPSGRARWFAPPALALGVALGAMGGCVLPGYDYTGASGTGDTGGGTTTTETGAGGSGGTTASQGGSGGTTSMSSGGSDPGGAPGTEWLRTYGIEDANRVASVAVGPADAIAIGGSMTTAIEFGADGPGPMLPYTGGDDGYAVRLDAGGIANEAIGFSNSTVTHDSSDQSVEAVALTGAGALVVAGHFQHEVAQDAALPFLGGEGSRDVFVTQLTSEGAYQWSVGIGGTDDDSVAGVMVDANGAVIVAGTYKGIVDVKGKSTVIYGQHDVYVAKIGSNGVVEWLQTFGSPSEDRARAVAVDPDGNITVVGQFDAAIAFEGGESIPNDTGSTNAFVVQLSPEGAIRFKKGFGTNGTQIAQAVAAAASGVVYVAGTFEGNINFGGADVPNVGPSDLFLMKLDGNDDGAVLGSTVIEDVGSHPSRLGLAVAPASAPVGGLVLAGTFSGTATFGTDTMTAEDTDAFIMRFDASDVPVLLWYKLITGSGPARASAAAFDSKGAVIVAGEFAGEADFGSETKTTDAMPSTFLLKLSPPGG